MLSVRTTTAAALLAVSSVMWPPGSEAGQIDYKTARSERKLPAVRAAGAIRIDGSLDEADWARAPVARGFIQSDPREGDPATEETDVRVLYDANNIYFGVFAHDREPRAILTSELVKDFNRDTGDDFEIILDTFHDERNGYVFATNGGEIGVDPTTENLIVPFEINRRRGIRGPGSGFRRNAHRCGPAEAGPHVLCWLPTNPRCPIPDPRSPIPILFRPSVESGFAASVHLRD